MVPLVIPSKFVVGLKQLRTKTSNPGRALEITAGKEKRISTVIVIAIECESYALLVKVVFAADDERLGLRLRESRKQQSGHNGNDGDNHEKLDQRESRTFRSLGCSSSAELRTALLATYLNPMIGGSFCHDGCENKLRGTRCR